MGRFGIDPYYDTPEWRTLRKAVCQRDKHICQYCGCKGHQADHVVPRRKGGPDAMENLVCACRECNKIVMGSVFPSFALKKAWILTARNHPEAPPPQNKREKVRLLRQPPRRSPLRQKLAERHNPIHFQEESLQKSRS